MATELRPVAEMTIDALVALKAETDATLGRLDSILLTVVPGSVDRKRDCLGAVREYLGAIEEEIGRRHGLDAKLIAPDLGWPGR